MFVWVTDVFRPAWLRWAASLTANVALLVVYAVVAATALRAFGVQADVLDGVLAALLVAPFSQLRRYPEARGSLPATVGLLLARSYWWVIGSTFWTIAAMVLAGSLRP